VTPAIFADSGRANGTTSTSSGTKGVQWAGISAASTAHSGMRAARRDGLPLVTIVGPAAKTVVPAYQAAAVVASSTDEAGGRARTILAMVVKA